MCREDPVQRSYQPTFPDEVAKRCPLYAVLCRIGSKQQREPTRASTRGADIGAAPEVILWTCVIRETLDNGIAGK